MNIAEYADAIERDGLRLLDAASVDLNARVPSCPDWDVRELITHIGKVYGYVTGVVSSPSLDRPTLRFSDFVPDRDVLSWGHRQLQSLVAAVRSIVPGTPCWNWGPGESIEFYPRRVAHETVVHRRDAEEAIADVTPLDSDLAADGVDEFVHVGLQCSYNPNWVFEYPQGSIHLHRTDGNGEWLLRVKDSDLVVTREHGKGDVAIRGTGANLFLYLWGRQTSDLEIFGDLALADRWSQLAP